MPCKLCCQNGLCTTRCMPKPNGILAIKYDSHLIPFLRHLLHIRELIKWELRDEKDFHQSIYCDLPPARQRKILESIRYKFDKNQIKIRNAARTLVISMNVPENLVQTCLIEAQ